MGQQVLEHVALDLTTHARCSREVDKHLQRSHTRACPIRRGNALTSCHLWSPSVHVSSTPLPIGLKPTAYTGSPEQWGLSLAHLLPSVMVSY